jgi:putative phosphoribosyl transferase
MLRLLAPPAFRDRRDAGRQLGERVAELALAAPVVMALPRGGVPVGYEVARRLQAPLDVVVVRKIGAPSAPEFGVGALGEEGVQVLDREALTALGLTEPDLAEVIAREREELERRVRAYRGADTPVDVHARTVVLVDDGAATGGTAAAGARILRERGARRVVLAVPVGARDLRRRIGDDVDDIVQLEAPKDFFAVGQAYESFGPTSDAEVSALLEAARTGANASVLADPPGERAVGGADYARVHRVRVSVPVVTAPLPGVLALPPNPQGLVVFAHGGGSSRHSQRNRWVAHALNASGLGTLLFDLLTPTEAAHRASVFDIDLLAHRLLAALDWAGSEPLTHALPLGCFGASTGAAAALQAATRGPAVVHSLVSRGGRPDLAAPWLERVQAPTLLIVGGEDHLVRALNEEAQQELRCPNELAIVPGATHLFEEPGALEEVARLSADWFRRYLMTSPSERVAALEHDGS